MRPRLYWYSGGAGSSRDFAHRCSDRANHGAGKTVAHAEALADTATVAHAEAQPYAYAQAAPVHCLLSQQEQAHPVQQGE